MDSREVTQAPLQRVAKALNVPVDAFFADGPIDTVTAGAAELLQLWQAISDPHDRATLMITARGLANRSDVERVAAE